MEQIHFCNQEPSVNVSINFFPEREAFEAGGPRVPHRDDDGRPCHPEVGQIKPGSQRLRHGLHPRDTHVLHKVIHSLSSFCLRASYL